MFALVAYALIDPRPQFIRGPFRAVFVDLSGPYAKQGAVGMGNPSAFVSVAFRNRVKHGVYRLLIRSALSL